MSDDKKKTVFDLELERIKRMPEVKSSLEAAMQITKNFVETAHSAGGIPLVGHFPVEGGKVVKVSLEYSETVQ